MQPERGPSAVAQPTSSNPAALRRCIELLQTCKSLPRLKQIHAHAVRHGVTLGHHVLAKHLVFALVSLPAADPMPYASSVFAQVPAPGVFSYNTMIRGYAESCHPRPALDVHRLMLAADVPPDSHTYPFLLKACAKLLSLRDGERVHCRSVKDGHDACIFVQNTLLHFYAACGLFESAHKLFERMSHRNLISWNSVINGFAINGRPNEALTLFREMVADEDGGIEPDGFTMVSLLCACAELGALALGRRSHVYLAKRGLDRNPHVGNALIDFYAKCGSIEEAYKVFDKMDERTVVSWTCLIVGLAMNGFGEESLDLFHAMERERLVPTEITLVGVLYACSHCGLVDDGFRYFNRMTREYGIVPKMEHYGCMVDLLGRAGLVEEAHSYIMNMPLEPNAVIWRTLLGACAMHKRLAIGEAVWARLVELDPGHSGDYVLLSNLYAAVGQWGIVHKLRRSMLKGGVKKMPGHSLVELGNRMHEFVMGDRSHPQSQQIYEMLEEIATRLRLEGYMPRTTNVLADIEEEEKETALNYHSERLAIAFALLNTAPGTPIRIVKNLRVTVVFSQQDYTAFRIKYQKCLHCHVGHPTIPASSSLCPHPSDGHHKPEQQKQQQQPHHHQPNCFITPTWTPVVRITALNSMPIIIKERKREGRGERESLKSQEITKQGHPNEWLMHGLVPSSSTWCSLECSFRMACKKLGSKADAFQRQGQAWFCTTGLPSDIIVEVGEMSFHLHKFPLLSKSALLEKLIEESSDEEEGCVVKLHDMPGGDKAFELVAKFCYGVKFELTASNVVCLRCAAEYLQMTEEIAEGNLIAQTEIFLNQVVLRGWKDSIKVLQTCDILLPHAENIQIIKRCIDSLAVKACTDPNLFGWPMMEHGAMQSPGGSVLWNGISTGARPRNCSSDWWYEDASSLSLPLYKRLISVMESRGIRQEVIAGSVTSYAKKYLPGISRRHSLAPVALTAAPSEEEQRHILEEIVGLLPLQKGVTSTKILFGLLRTGMILRANPTCISNLEKRIGLQLDQANLEDLLLPNFSYSMETLYNIDCVQRILEHFLAMDQVADGASPNLVDDEQLIGSPSLAPITTVAKLIDGYLAEVAPDINLKLPKFQNLASAVPDYARPLDDGLYRAIDIYLKAHPWLNEAEREQLCRLMDCQKLSLEACTHAAQNERLPLRVVVQVLFFEQLQLRTSIAGCLLVSDNLDGSRPLRSGLVGSGDGGGWASAVRENQVLKEGMDSMRMRVYELEKECTSMRQEIEKLGRGKSKWSTVSKKFGFKLKSQMCSAQEESVSDHQKTGSSAIEKLPAKLTKHKQQLSTDA
ncbi:NPH3 family [Musa troglodytarum]|uniref:NPH3 family n=1 Tax=Musa troglodytarum TaxID=320322 RepID=A0A9E7H5Z1_9LILI|nr:NPH3 family [Musa troglodytarum]